MSGCTNANTTAGVVRRVAAGYAWIEAAPASCGQCSGQGACGSGLLGLRSQPRQYRLPNTIDAHVGDTVTVSIASGGVLKGALLAYAMPLGLGFLGAATAMTLGGGDLLTAAGLLAGIGAGWLLLRLLPGSQELGATIALKPTDMFAPRLTKEIQS